VVLLGVVLLGVVLLGVVILGVVLLGVVLLGVVLLGVVLLGVVLLGVVLLGVVLRVVLSRMGTQLRQTPLMHIKSSLQQSDPSTCTHPFSKSATQLPSFFPTGLRSSESCCSQGIHTPSDWPSK